MTRINVDEFAQALSGRYGDEYLLRQLAEECAELNQAALKLIRAERRETPKGRMAAEESLVEEIADVLLTIEVVLGAAIVSEMYEGDIMRIRHKKLQRWKRRMLDGGEGDE